MLGLNPLLLTFGVNDAHCDVLVGLAVLIAALTLQTKRWLWAGLALGVAVSIKGSAAPAVVAACVWAWCCFGRAAALRIGLAASVVVGAGLVFAGGLDVVQPLRDASRRHTRFSVWNPVHDALGGWLGTGPPTLGPADGVVATASGIVVAAVGCFFIYRHRNDAAPFAAVVVGLIAYQVLGAYVLAWYVAWSLPVLALIWRSRTALVAFAHASWLALAYLNGYLAIAVAVLSLGWFVLRRFQGKAAFPWLSSSGRPILAGP